MRKASPGEVLQKVEKEVEMISEGHLEAVAAAWQEEAETGEFQGDRARVRQAANGGWQVKEDQNGVLCSGFS